MIKYDTKFKFTVVETYPLPQCLEGATFNILDNKCYLCFGFCGGWEGWGDRVRPRWKVNTHPKTSYTRGFSNFLFVMDLSSQLWSSYILPLESRSNLDSIIVDNNLLLAGGYSYTPLTQDELQYYKKNSINLPTKKDIFTKNDGCIINFNEINHNKIGFKNLNIGKSLTEHSIVKNPINNDIYILNGAQYTEQAFKTNDKMFINRYYLDNKGDFTRDKNIQFADFKGTLRFASNCFIVNNFIYMLGGCSSTDEYNKHKGYTESSLANVLDCWRYDISNNTWLQLNDFPLAMSYQKGKLYKNKYYIFVGGVCYNTSINLKKIQSSDLITKNYPASHRDLFRYNGISSLKNDGGPGVGCDIDFKNQHSNMIVIYNIETDSYTVSKNTLPLNISAAPVEIVGDFLYIGGGEAGVNKIKSGNTKYFFGIQLGCMIKIKISELITEFNLHQKYLKNVIS